MPTSPWMLQIWACSKRWSRPPDSFTVPLPAPVPWGPAQHHKSSCSEALLHLRSMLMCICWQREVQQGWADAEWWCHCVLRSSEMSFWSWGRCLGAGPPASAPKPLKNVCILVPMLISLPQVIYSTLPIAQTVEKTALCLHLTVLTQLMHITANKSATPNRYL